MKDEKSASCYPNVQFNANILSYTRHLLNQRETYIRDTQLQQKKCAQVMRELVSLIIFRHLNSELQ